MDLVSASYVRLNTTYTVGADRVLAEIREGNPNFPLMREAAKRILGALKDGEASDLIADARKRAGPNARTTHGMARSVRDALANNPDAASRSHRQIAKKYSVSQSTLGHACARLQRGVKRRREFIYPE